MGRAVRPRPARAGISSARRWRSTSSAELGHRRARHPCRRRRPHLSASRGRDRAELRVYREAVSRGSGCTASSCNIDGAKMAKRYGNITTAQGSARKMTSTPAAVRLLRVQDPLPPGARPDGRGARPAPRRDRGGWASFSDRLGSRARGFRRPEFVALANGSSGRSPRGSIDDLNAPRGGGGALRVRRGGEPAWTRDGGRPRAVAAWSASSGSRRDQRGHGSQDHGRGHGAGHECPDERAFERSRLRAASAAAARRWADAGAAEKRAGISPRPIGSGIASRRPVGRSGMGGMGRSRW